ncbi:MAG TPA: hypothetical protein VIM94_01185 [Salegentibacter sp.]|uniref:hypothetical protein n=1 Tax=Salegentibacter sp. TaxID=1903072 RepID=UPI002F932C5C
MGITGYKTAAQNSLQEPGIEVNGKQPWYNYGKNDNFYQVAPSRGSLGFGESYMEAWWECRALDKKFHRLFRANLEEKNSTRYWLWLGRFC